MIINSWLILDPEGDRPYLCLNPPLALARKPGMQLFRVEIDVPEPMPVDGVIQAKAVKASLP